MASAASPFRSAHERAEDRARKRDALLRAAVGMFNDRGFHATSLDDVAASLGVTKPVIYHYLGNKDQVLLECVRIGIDQMREAADAARHVAGTGLDRLKAFLRDYARLHMDDFGRCVARTSDEALSPESRAEFRLLKRKLDTTLRDMIAEAAADGSAAVHDVRFTAFALAGALGWTARWHKPDGALSADEVARRIVDIACAGIEPA